MHVSVFAWNPAAAGIKGSKLKDLASLIPLLI